MNRITEILGTEVTERLKERYGELVDCIGVEEQGQQIFKVTFQLSDRKRMPARSTNMDKERAIGVGVAEIECAIYRVLNFSGGREDEGIHINNNLPEEGVYMHRKVYMELMEFERDSIERIRVQFKKVGNTNDK